MEKEYKHLDMKMTKEDKQKYKSKSILFFIP